MYCLHKALYELKQIFKVWYQTLRDFFNNLSIKQLKLDYNIFVSQN